MSQDAHSPQVQFEKLRQGEFVIIRIRGRFRAIDFKDFNRLFQEFLDEDGEWLLLDVSDMRVIQSPVVGSILGISKLLAQLGKRIGMINPSDHIRYMLHITRLTEIMPIFDSLEDALRLVESDMTDQEDSG